MQHKLHAGNVAHTHTRRQSQRLSPFLTHSHSQNLYARSITLSVSLSPSISLSLLGTLALCFNKRKWKIWVDYCQVLLLSLLLFHFFICAFKKQNKYILVQYKNYNTIVKFECDNYLVKRNAKLRAALIF